MSDRCDLLFESLAVLSADSDVLVQFSLQTLHFLLADDCGRFVVGSAFFLGRFDDCDGGREGVPHLKSFLELVEFLVDRLFGVLLDLEGKLN